MDRNQCNDRAGKACCRCKTILTDFNWCRSNQKHKLNQCNNCTRAIQRTSERKRNINTYRNGKEVSLRGDKRSFPTNSKCELCSSKRKQLAYHHWDDSNLLKGMWICHSCHLLCNALERLTEVFRDKYFTLKQKIGETHGQNTM